MKTVEPEGCESEPLDSAQRASLAVSRSRVYGFLAAVYNRSPDHQFAEGVSSADLGSFLASLAEREGLPQDVREGVRLIERFSRASKGKPVDEVRTELTVERTRLLRGVRPDHGPPPPYESLYRGSEGQAETRVSAAVAREYAQAGVALADGMREQPDYVGLELDFMRHLTEKEAEAWAKNEPDEAETYLDLEQAFLREHIVRWIPRFCDVVIEQADLDFYRGMAQVTKGFIEDELQKMKAMSD